MSSVEVLISCMHQIDASIVEHSRICTDTIIINQSNKNEMINISYDFGQVKMFSSTQRGLSNSRNMALKHASGEFCLLCDDDEVMTNQYADIIMDAFQHHPDVDVLCFNVVNPRRTFWDTEKRVGYKRALHMSSWQICFRLQSIREHDIQFDPFLGSGTGNGGGEDNKFLIDCLKAGLKIRYIPATIAQVSQKKSQWFHGYNADFFYNRGISTTHTMGYILAFLYSLYYAVFKYKKYKKDISYIGALVYTWRGICGYQKRRKTFNKTLNQDNE